MRRSVGRWSSHATLIRAVEYCIMPRQGKRLRRFGERPPWVPQQLHRAGWTVLPCAGLLRCAALHFFRAEGSREEGGGGGCFFNGPFCKLTSWRRSSEECQGWCSLFTISQPFRLDSQRSKCHLPIAIHTKKAQSCLSSPLFSIVCFSAVDAAA